MALKLEYADDDIEIESQGVKIALYVNAWNGEIKNVDKGVIITFNSYVSSDEFDLDYEIEDDNYEDGYLESAGGVLLYGVTIPDYILSIDDIKYEEDDYTKLTGIPRVIIFDQACKILNCTKKELVRATQEELPKWKKIVEEHIKDRLEDSYYDVLCDWVIPEPPDPYDAYKDNNL